MPKSGWNANTEGTRACASWQWVRHHSTSRIPPLLLAPPASSTYSKAAAANLGPQRAARKKAHLASLRAIRASNKADIARLGLLTPAAITAIVAAFRAPHCDNCTTHCGGCASMRGAGMPPCEIPHTCGRASDAQLENEGACLLAHARRPCVHPRAAVLAEAHRLEGIARGH